MTQKEINELKARVYSISNCMFPLDVFLNDIEQNKNQNYDKERVYNDLKLITDAVYELKEKLKEKEQDYTLEEVKKMWEELGYEWKEDEIFITLIKQKYDKSIKINKKLKDYKCYDLFMTPTLLHTNNIALFITFQEHQLLTKTIKALEKEKK